MSASEVAYTVVLVIIGVCVLAVLIISKQRQRSQSEANATSETDRRDPVAQFAVGALASYIDRSRSPKVARKGTNSLAKGSDESLLLPSLESRELRTTEPLSSLERNTNPTKLDGQMLATDTRHHDGSAWVDRPHPTVG